MLIIAKCCSQRCGWGCRHLGKHTPWAQCVVMVSRILYSCSAFCQPGVLMGSLWTVRESWQKAEGNKFQQSQGNYACDVSPSLIGVLLSSKCSLLVVTRIIYCL